jgi:FtsH-binding integral membrane protein
MGKFTFLYLCGIYNLAFAIFHVTFWKIFKWNEDLKKTSLANRAVIQILNIRLIYIFLLMSFIYFFCTEELIGSKIGFVLLIGFLGFWIGRTVEQFIFLRVKSKMVTILTVIFFIGIIIHLLPLVI